MYFRARYYDPTTGEFIAPDPMGYIDGPSLFRGYFNLNYADPFGLQIYDDPTRPPAPTIIWPEFPKKCTPPAETRSHEMKIMKWNGNYKDLGAGNYKLLVLTQTRTYFEVLDAFDYDCGGTSPFERTHHITRGHTTTTGWTGTINIGGKYGQNDVWEVGGGWTESETHGETESKTVADTITLKFTPDPCRQGVVTFYREMKETTITVVWTWTLAGGGYSEGGDAKAIYQ